MGADGEVELYTGETLEAPVSVKRMLLVMGEVGNGIFVYAVKKSPLVLEQESVLPVGSYKKWGQRLDALEQSNATLHQEVQDLKQSNTTLERFCFVTISNLMIFHFNQPTNQETR